jgi:hypothetical protein
VFPLQTWTGTSALSEEGHGIPREENMSVYQAKDKLGKDHREDSDPNDSGFLIMLISTELLTEMSRQTKSYALWCR